MNKTFLTSLELQFMKAIPADDFYEAGFESVLWTDVFFDAAGIDPKQGRGIISSLIKKGFVRGGAESFELTSSGVAWLKANFELDDEGYAL